MSDLNEGPVPERLIIVIVMIPNRDGSTTRADVAWAQKNKMTIKKVVQKLERRLTHLASAKASKK